jgi:general secretion pathway protein I
VRRGFTLLEVMVAIAILGLGLTVILSSQAGLFSSAQRAENLSVATGLARCRMSEIEVKLLQEGYPLTEQTDSGACCEDSEIDVYKCEWKVQPVKLPEPAGVDALGGDGGIDDTGGMGPLGALATVQQTGGASLGDGGIGSLASMLTTASGDKPPQDGIASMAMGLVYPDLKPMLEASIRKVTVTVNWKEGNAARDYSIVQYVTNPQQGGLDPNAAAGLEGLEQLLPGSESTGATDTPTTGGGRDTTGGGGR